MFGFSLIIVVPFVVNILIAVICGVYFKHTVIDDLKDYEYCKFHSSLSGDNDPENWKIGF